MPELPEVESVRRGLAQWVPGAVVNAVRVLDPRILGTTSHRVVTAEAPVQFAAQLSGVRLGQAGRRGKFLWIELAGGAGLALSVHLGMSGQFRIHAPGEPLHRHTRAVFELHRPGLAGSGVSAGGEPVELRFVDQRIFGHLGVDAMVSSAGQLVPASAAHIALDALDPDCDFAAVTARIQRKRSALKAALLDQTVVSGIGNIYADEALFRAGVHPLAVAARTRPARIRATLTAARDVMTEALAQGGTSFDELYVNVNGESGYFERSLHVYGRAGKPCNRCGTLIVRERFMNRSSHFCPRCQRKR